MLCAGWAAVDSHHLLPCRSPRAGGDVEPTGEQAPGHKWLAQSDRAGPLQVRAGAPRQFGDPARGGVQPLERARCALPPRRRSRGSQARNPLPLGAPRHRSARPARPERQRAAPPVAVPAPQRSRDVSSETATVADPRHRPRAPGALHNKSLPRPAGLLSIDPAAPLRPRCFLDVSSLNLAVPHNGAAFLFYAGHACGMLIGQIGGLGKERASS